MTAVTVALVVAALLCLAVDARKWIGVAGVALLLYLHPLLITALLILGGAVLHFIRYYKRRLFRELPRSPTRRD